MSEGGANKLICSGLPKAKTRLYGVLVSHYLKEYTLAFTKYDDSTSIQGNFKVSLQEQNYYGQLVYFCE